MAAYSPVCMCVCEKERERDTYICKREERVVHICVRQRKQLLCSSARLHMKQYLCIKEETQKFFGLI